MADSLNAIERKEIAKLAETCGYKSTHCTLALEFSILIFRSINTSLLAPYAMLQSTGWRRRNCCTSIDE